MSFLIGIFGLLVFLPNDGLSRLLGETGVEATANQSGGSPSDPLAGLQAPTLEQQKTKTTLQCKNLIGYLQDSSCSDAREYFQTPATCPSRNAAQVRLPGGDSSEGASFLSIQFVEDLEDLNAKVDAAIALKKLNPTQTERVEELVVVDHLIIRKIKRRYLEDFLPSLSCQPHDLPTLAGKAMAILTISLSFFQSIHPKGLVAVAYSIFSGKKAAHHSRGSPIRIQHLYCTSFVGAPVSSCDSMPNSVDPVVDTPAPDVLADTAIDYYNLGVHLYSVLHCNKGPFDAPTLTEMKAKKLKGDYSFKTGSPAIWAFAIAWLLQDDRKMRSSLLILRHLVENVDVPEVAKLTIPYLQLSTKTDPRKIPEFKELFNVLDSDFFAERSSNDLSVRRVESDGWNFKRLLKKYTWIIIGSGLALLILPILIALIFVKRDGPSARGGSLIDRRTSRPSVHKDLTARRQSGS